MNTYTLVDRIARPGGSRVRIGAVEVGGPEFVVAAGPCAVESEEQILEIAFQVAGAGARLLRGGAFKPRTSPYSFQGLGADGLWMLARAGNAAGLPTVTEVLTAEDVPLVAKNADALQVGARNMQNFALLKALGSAGRPVVLKRGLASTLDELLLAAEYILLHGNEDVILCERGIRTFEPSTRNTLDLNAVALLKQLTHLPVFVDPSHAAGRRDLIAPAARAAAAVGADGLLIEVHSEPERALSDGAQSITPAMFAEIMGELGALAPLHGRTLAAGTARRVGRHQLSLFRNRIDRIDEALLALLAERARIAVEAGRVKTILGDSLHCPEREQAILSRLAQRDAAPLAAGAIRHLFENIIAETSAVETRATAIHEEVR